jgi:hypothetical protein
LASLEKKTYGYCQRDEEKRQAFAGQLSTIPPEKIVYLDESGTDSLHQYDYGWNSLWSALPCPQIMSAPGTGEHNCCQQCNQNPIAPFTIEGACNRTVLETWLESCLLPTLTIGQVVVMDNATFHKGGRIRELIETAGCQLLYLPPYSPDLNLH